MVVESVMRKQVRNVLLLFLSVLHCTAFVHAIYTVFFYHTFEESSEPQAKPKSADIVAVVMPGISRRQNP